MLMRTHRRPLERKGKKGAAKERAQRMRKRQPDRKLQRKRLSRHCTSVGKVPRGVLKAGLKPHQPQAPQTTMLTYSALNGICMLAHSWEDYQQSHLVQTASLDRKPSTELSGLRAASKCLMLTQGPQQGADKWPQSPTSQWQVQKQVPSCHRASPATINTRIFTL